MSYSETIFLTGFPGFIAERLVERLSAPNTKFYLLVQSSFAEKARRDVEKIAQRTDVLKENFELIVGDITLENLGIGEKDLEKVRSETTSVFHLAAVYDLSVEKDLAFLVNAEGTKNVNDFVRSLQNLRRYNYVSTCYVAGQRKGEILETELEHDAGFRNYYEETKYLAELSVEKLKSEVPTTIFRPSVVVGDSRTGETAKYDGIYYLMLYLRKAPNLLRFINVGNVNVKLNLVPVDFVVEGIAALAADEAATGKTIALADPNPLTTEELFDAISEALVGKKSVIKPSPKLIEWSLHLKVSPPMTGLPFPAVPYFFIPQTYSTSVAEKLLKPHNVACPNFRTYVGNLLKFVEQNPTL
ncbi:MAG: Sterol-4-alpha-carboxylate 3-dehydrogenase [Acidobacteria bacterium]|jgi:thioester reductase-like protein|nr:Sterol-4-alpha-carboxylate 3-dehydrogenase [Acidobacteriota bacterium]